jgi:hypothetical protein
MQSVFCFRQAKGLDESWLYLLNIAVACLHKTAGLEGIAGGRLHAICCQEHFTRKSGPVIYA